MGTNWKKLYAMKDKARVQLYKHCPQLNNESGIYIIRRFDENEVRYAYIGQALHLEERLISHLLGYSQRIDISLKKRKLYDMDKNPYGWTINIVNYKESDLDMAEQLWIKQYIKDGYQMYNKTLGSQGEGKVSINDGQSTKGYHDGLKQGYSNAIKDIKEFFDKYLDYVAKDIKNKDGSTPKIIENKLKEFKDLLERE